jgi:hypothetical protein
VRKKKSSQKKKNKKLTWVKERKKKKVNLSSPTLVNPGIGRDEKGEPINAPSIHIGGLVGALKMLSPSVTVKAFILGELWQNI